MNLPPARRPWLVSSELSHSSAHTRDSGDETRAGTRRKEAEERARACGWKRVQRGDRSRRGSGHLRDGDTRERERAPSPGRSSAPSFASFQSRCNLNTATHTPRVQSARERGGSKLHVEAETSQKNSRDLISLFAEKKSRQNRPPPFPPADSSSAVAHRLHFAQGHREQINGQLTLARIVAVAFLGKELRRCGEESFFLAL